MIRFAALTFGIVLGAVASLAQEPISRPDVGVAERSSLGSFAGTWAYASRDDRFALWFRESNGGIEMRVGYASAAGSESFETDWKGDADYTFGPAGTGTVRVRLTESNRDELRGTWDWTAKIGDRTRSQSGSFTVYRALDGRSLVLDFQDWTWTLAGPEGERTASPRRALQFTKVSKRLALWDELPF